MGLSPGGVVSRGLSPVTSQRLSMPILLVAVETFKMISDTA